MAFNPTPFFSWSSSREEMFNECELCYLLHYYTAHNGWVSSSPVEARAAYRWKKAHTLNSLMFETLVEALIERVHGDVSSLKDVRRKVLQELNGSFEASVKQKEEWYTRPNSVNMLYELVYEDTISNEMVSEVKKELDTCLVNFKKTQLVKELHDSEIVPVRANFKRGYTYFAHELGMRVYAGVQVVHKRPDGKLVATMFKTKDKPSTLSAAGAVARVVAETTNTPYKDIIVRDEFLLSGKYSEVVLDENSIKSMDMSLRDSVSMMQDFLVDGDIDKNEFIGYRNVQYSRSINHEDADRNECQMHECPYCEAVRRDMELYPKGYDASKSILKY